MVQALAPLIVFTKETSLTITRKRKLSFIKLCILYEVNVTSPNPRLFEQRLPFFVRDLDMQGNEICERYHEKVYAQNLAGSILLPLRFEPTFALGECVTNCIKRIVETQVRP
jgi:hypothetical protein